MKHCRKCDRFLPANADFFCRNKQTKDGLYFCCNDCRKNQYAMKHPKKVVVSVEEGFKQCAKCKKSFLATTDFFHNNHRCRDGLHFSCKDCRRNEVKEQVIKNPNYWKEKHQKYKPKTPEKIKKNKISQAQNMRKYRARRRVQALNNGMCGSCFMHSADIGKRCKQCQEAHKRWTEKNREFVNAKQKQYRNELRNQVLNAYGGVCVCCGENNPAFLTIDHVYGRGREHARSIKGHLYSWLRKNNFPQDGFQLLCHSCNHAKFVYGICPHQKVNF
jgi:hypothetical protein